MQINLHVQHSIDKSKMSNYLHNNNNKLNLFTIINLPDSADKQHRHHDNLTDASSTSTSSAASTISSSKDCHHNHNHNHHHHHDLNEHQHNNLENHRHQTIDSLHGIRFLSMIWIIVIHSYNFALRWSFFSNTSSLDNIYKNSASQLLANGTFACDSFLLVGGFLLLYLAFPELTPPPKPPNNDNEEEEEDDDDDNYNHKDDDATSSDKRRRDKSSLETKITSSSSQSELAGSVSVSQSQSSVSCCCCCGAGGGGRLAGAETEKETLFILHKNKFTLRKVFLNLLHRYVRMMPLMMAIIALSSTLLRYLGSGQQWDDSTIMFDKWCRDNWWINLFFLHNFLNRENMCLSHSWYSAVDIQLFFLGQLILFALFRSKRFGLFLIFMFLFIAQLTTGLLTIIHNLPAVPLISSVSEQSENLYYGEIYIKPYCRASPYLIGILLAYLMRTTSLGQVRLSKLQTATGWAVSIGTIYAILMAMQPAMNGQPLSKFQAALYSALSRPLWACATGWMIFACMTKNAFVFGRILGAKAFIPLSRLTYPAFLIHPIVIAISYGSRQSNFQFSHYLMLYLILGNIVITYASAFLLSILFELPFLSAERALKRVWSSSKLKSSSCSLFSSSACSTTYSNNTTTTTLAPSIRLSTPN